VLGNSGTGDPEAASKCPDAEIMAQKELKKLKASLVPQGLEYREKLIHRRIF
jgi:hypothetical protein